MKRLLNGIAIALGLATVIAVFAASAYVFWFRDDDGNKSAPDPDAGSARVMRVDISNEIDSNGLPVNPRLVFPAETKAIRATVLLSGIEIGMLVKGTWFQLGSSNAGAEGAEISSSQVSLTSEQVLQDGTGALSFSLGTSGPALPSDTWLLRIYINGKLIKTSGFVIGGAGAPAR